MAVMTTIDPDWQFQVNQVTRILEKVGAEHVTVYKHTPDYPNGYIITAHKDDKLWQIAGESLPHITESFRDKLKALEES